MTSHSKYVISIDPAQSGACTVLRKDATVQLLFALCWKKVSRQKRKVYKVDIFDHRFPNKKKEIICAHPAKIMSLTVSLLHEEFQGSIDNEIENGRVQIIFEDAYLGRSPKTSISIARFAGRLAGVLENQFNIESLWVRPSVWRKAIMDLSHFTKRAQAKEASLFHIPKMIDHLPKCLTVLGRLDHITDAAGVGLYVWKDDKK